MSNRKYHIDFKALQESEKRSLLGRNTPTSTPPYEDREQRVYQRPDSSQKPYQSSNLNRNSRGLSSNTPSLATRVMRWALKFVEGFNAFVLFSGIIVGNATDLIMGSLAVSMNINPSVISIAGINGLTFGAMLSISLSAIQLYMWNILRKKKIYFTDIIKWKKLDREVKQFLSVALSLWVMDTFLDISPLNILISNLFHLGSPVFFEVIKWVIIIVTTVLCSLAEPLTVAMGNMISEDD
jgi:hypothetical protein